MSAQPEPQKPPKDPIPENAKPISEIINDFLSRLDDPNFDPLKMPWPKQCCAVCAKPLDHSPEPVLVHAGSGIMFCSEKCVEYFRKNFAEFYKEHNFHYNPNDPFFRFSFDPDDWVEVVPCQCGAIPVVTQNTVAKIKCPECGSSVGANSISLQTLALGWNNLKGYADHVMDQLREANEREPKLWTLHLDPIKPLGDVTCETTPCSHATSFSSLFSKTSTDSPAPDPLSTQVGGEPVPENDDEEDDIPMCECCGKKSREPRCDGWIRREGGRWFCSKKCMDDWYERRQPNEHETPLSYQVGGDHYAQFPYQPIQFFHDRHLNAFQANIIKYLARWRSKNGLEDLKKAEHYLLVAELNQAHDLEQTAIFLEQFPEEERAIMDLALCNYFGTARQKLHELIERLEAEQTETEAEKENQ